LNTSTFWFLAVGASAALTHLAVFSVAEHAMWPELANALGFVVAFGVSFTGHRQLSFQDAGTPLLTSLRRFAVTALLGFVNNELVFILLLRGLDWPAIPALMAALVAAAVQTFVLSRFWAFRR
jgi:putative flippase GtrA